MTRELSLRRSEERERNRAVRIAAAALLVATLATAGWVQAGEAASARSTAVIAIVQAGPLGASTPAGFVGLSFEYSAVPAYAGAPSAINPALVQLIRNLAPGRTPVLRIGGDSTDTTWWPVRGVRQPGIVNYTLTRGWLQTTAALARATGARLILGINLATNDPRLAAAEARALLAGIGRRSIEALEVGNEPDVYQSFPAYRNAHGAIVHVRGPRYDFGTYLKQFSAVRRALPRLPIAGPALGGAGWISKLGQFITAEPSLRLVTLHFYPLVCFAPPSSPLYPTIAHLLSDASTTDLARSLAGPAEVAHANGLELRVGELNSVTCGGRLGVSNTFASALWALDTLFALDQAGVDGVNFHTFPGAIYAPFSFTDAGGQWSASVLPEYYAMLMFGRAAPPGSRILPVKTVPAGPVKVWATVAHNKTVRVVLINERASSEQVLLTAPPGATGPAASEQLLAPSLTATSGVSLGGQSFGSSTDTGILTGPPEDGSIARVKGVYPVTLPPDSATLLSWRPGV